MDLRGLPASVLPDLVGVLPSIVARKQMQRIEAASFPHFDKADQRRILLGLRVDADPDYIDRLRPKKDKDNG